MSLKDAMLEIADQMQESSKETVHTEDRALLLGFCRQIRSACKAAPDADAPPSMNPLLLGMGVGSSPAAQNAIAIERAKAEFRKEKGKEDHGDSMALCQDGPSEGDMAPVPPGMPVGARCHVAGAVYELRGDGRLWHVEGGGQRLTKGAILEGGKG